MSEDNKITTAILKPNLSDDTVVTPKVQADSPAGSAAVDETRLNPKISAPVLGAEPSAAPAAATSSAAAADERTAAAEKAAKAAAGPVRDRTGRVKTTSSGTVRPARKARLRIAKLDPWSVMKTALMFSVAAAIILFVAVALLWSVIEASGALDTLQETLNSLLGNPDGSGSVEVSSFIDRWRVLGFTAIVSGINVILLTALATLAAFLYNLSSSVLGGLDITLAED